MCNNKFNILTQKTVAEHISGVSSNPRPSCVGKYAMSNILHGVVHEREYVYMFTSSDIVLISFVLGSKKCAIKAFFGSPFCL